MSPSYIWLLRITSLAVHIPYNLSWSFVITDHPLGIINKWPCGLFSHVRHCCSSSSLNSCIAKSRLARQGGGCTLGFLAKIPYGEGWSCFWGLVLKIFLPLTRKLKGINQNVDLLLKLINKCLALRVIILYCFEQSTIWNFSGRKWQESWLSTFHAGCYVFCYIHNGWVCPHICDEKEENRERKGKPA